jgi:predicted small secreted protein
MNRSGLNILKSTQRTLAAVAIILVAVIIAGCSNTMDGEGSEGNHGEEGEEPGTQLALNETYDTVSMIEKAGANTTRNTKKGFQIKTLNAA